MTSNIMTVGQLKQALQGRQDNEVLSVETSEGYSYLIAGVLRYDWSGPTLAIITASELGSEDDDDEDYGQPDNWYD